MADCITAADKSMAAQTVRSRGFLWLNHVVMSVVNCSRDKVVESSYLKPSWSGAGRKYVLMVSRIRVSMTFAAGPRSEMGRYEVPWDMPLTDLSIVMNNEDLNHIT